MLINTETKQPINVGDEVTAIDGKNVIVFDIGKSSILLSYIEEFRTFNLDYINAEWVDDVPDTKINFTPGNSNTGPNPVYHYAPDINSMSPGQIIIDYFDTYFMVVKINDDQYEPVDLNSGDSAEVSDIACPWKLGKRSELDLKDK